MIELSFKIREGKSVVVLKKLGSRNIFKFCVNSFGTACVVVEWLGAKNKKDVNRMNLILGKKRKRKKR